MAEATQESTVPPPAFPRLSSLPPLCCRSRPCLQTCFNGDLVKQEMAGLSPRPTREWRGQGGTQTPTQQACFWRGQGEWGASWGRHPLSRLETTAVGWSERGFELLRSPHTPPHPLRADAPAWLFTPSPWTAALRPRWPEGRWRLGQRLTVPGWLLWTFFLVQN